MNSNNVVLLKEISDSRLRMIYREDGTIVKHDFWYTRPAEGFVFIPRGAWVDPRSQEVHFAINMELHGSRYDKDSGVVAVVPVKRSDYDSSVIKRIDFQSKARNMMYMAAIEYWKMTSHAIGEKLVYRNRRGIDRVIDKDIEIRAA